MACARAGPYRVAMTSKTPHLKLLVVRTTLIAAETLEVILEENGALGSAIERKRGARLVHLQAYFPDQVEIPVDVVREKIREMHEYGLPVGPGGVRVKTLPREDWAESWKRHFGVAFPTPKLQIVPIWEKPVDGKGDVLWIDPGMAFGLGDHPTTRGCLEMMERLEPWGVSHPPDAPPTPGSVEISTPGVGFPTADVGSGTGILAIRAVQLGIGPVEAFETDTEAVRCGNENAATNGVTDRIVFREGTMPVRRVGPYRLVLANLFLTILVQLLPRFSRSLAADGELIVAGITGDQEDRLCEETETRGFRVVDRICKKAQPGGRRWPVLRLRKSDSPGA